MHGAAARALGPPDLEHICEESGVGAKIASALIPRARVGKPAREVAHDLALHGGEDYELLFTMPVGATAPRGVTRIGQVVRGVAGEIRFRGRLLEARGYDHFGKLHE